MTLRLFDSAAGAVRDFVPLVPGHVGIYVCGATPQGSPHLGHVRAQVVFDVLRRWLLAAENGVEEVTVVRNVTDIDDKILAKSAEAEAPWWAWAYRFEQQFTAAYDAVGVRRPTYEPRATGHVTEMHELVAELVGRGHAYPAPDGSGDVYFDVASWPAYGELTHQKVADMVAAGDADPRGKRDPRDFALWKGTKDGDPATASWPSPWGHGRPGWHLECSAMARRYLGTGFDIHAGGLDLRFPHHENEQAQSRAAGDEFAAFWLHNGLVAVKGEKMSKSLGNSLVVAEVLRSTSPLVLRYALGTAHYRSTIDHSEQTLAEAEAAVGRIEGFLRRAEASPDVRVGVPFLPDAFRAAMDDDLNVPAALAVVHETVRAGNSALDAGDRDAVLSARTAVTAMTRVLGIDPLDPHWGGGAGGADGQLTAALDTLVAAALTERAEARAAKDWARADAVRDRLAAAGVVVADGSDGSTWTLAAPAAHD